MATKPAKKEGCVVTDDRHPINSFKMWLFVLVSVGMFSAFLGSISAEQTVIRVLSWSTGAAFEQEIELHPSFNTVQNKIKVELESVTGNIQEKAIIMMVAGEAPDILHQPRVNSALQERGMRQ